MQSKVLVGADEFMHALDQRAKNAIESLYIQAMTFEGDSAGEAIIDLMLSSPARDKRLIVDSFSKAVISDHFVFGLKYLKDSQFKCEVQNTYSLIRKAETSGIKVKFVNPTGPMMLRYPLRNHKKMMIVDGEYSFIGGINFSDHNFEWHDMMVELQDSSIGKELKEDFLHTWDGTNQSKKVVLGRSHLYFFNGLKSKLLYEDFFNLIQDAQLKITVVSPYVSDPLLPLLIKKAQAGVEIEIISPAQNNKGLFHDYLISQYSEESFKLLHHPGMFHLKAMIIDGSQLIFGSSNYDLISYHFEQEIVMVTEHKDLLNQFELLVLNPMRSASTPYNAVPKKASKSKLIMRMLKIFCRVASQTVLKTV